ncbi:MAG: cytidylate kinase-like family protein [bacterium]|nr:cytidylate kinase-like family protein [bacterium]
MKNLENIERYLSAEAARMRERDTTSSPRVRPFVTISRQAGAGGHDLAQSLVEVFAAQDDADLFEGWQVFDRKLCEMVARNPIYSVSMSSLLAEEYRTKTNDFFHQILRSTVDQGTVMNEVFRVVAAVASIGKCIIVGRAGSEVTRALSPGVAVRLVAPEEVRVRGVMEFYGLDEKTARAEAVKLDASRARLLDKHFGADIDDPTLYDGTWNTGQVAVPVIAENVATILRHRVAAAELSEASM